MLEIYINELPDGSTIHAQFNCYIITQQATWPKLYHPKIHCYDKN